MARNRFPPGGDSTATEPATQIQETAPGLDLAAAAADSPDTAISTTAEPYGWLRPHQWKPGQSGNPSGRPKGVSLTNAMLRELSEADAKKIVRNLIRRASKNHKDAEHLWDRLEGPVTQKIEHSGEMTLSLEAIARMRQRADADE